MDDDSPMQDGPDASAIAVEGSFDQDPRQTTRARESGWHDDIDLDQELDQFLSEVERVDPSPPATAAKSRAASSPTQQSAPFRMTLSELLYGNAELRESEAGVAMTAMIGEINRMNEQEAKTTLTMAAMYKVQKQASQDNIIRRLEQDVITAKLETARLQAQMQATPPKMPTVSSLSITADNDDTGTAETLAKEERSATASGTGDAQRQSAVMRAANSRRSTLSRADSKAAEARIAALKDLVDSIADAEVKPLEMPMSPEQLVKTLEKVKEKAAAMKKSTKADTEADVLEATKEILVAAHAGSKMLKNAVETSRDFGTLVKLYKAAKDDMKDTMLSEEQKKQYNIQQIKAEIQRQDDATLVIIVEVGFSKLSRALESRCLEMPKDGDEKPALRTARDTQGAGMLYLAEAMAQLCRSTWDMAKRDLQNLFLIPEVIEGACNGSMRSMRSEITRIFDNFQNKHGEINREKIEGLVWLTVVEKLRTQRPISKLGRMVQKQIDDRKVDERQHDLVAGLEQVMKLVELVSVEESKACDTMGLVDLQIKDVEKEIDRLQLQRTQESGNNASTNDYKGGYQAGVMVGMKAVLADKEPHKVLGQTVLTVNHKETLKKITDESKLIGDILKKTLDTVEKIDGKGLETKECDTLRGLTNRLQSLQQKIGQDGSRQNNNGGGGNRGRSTTRNQNASAREPSTSAREKDCVFWLRGECNREQCAFKHDQEKKGSNPDAQLPKRRDRSRGARGASPDRESRADIQDAPKCDLCDNPAQKKRDGSFHKHCKDCYKAKQNSQQSMTAMEQTALLSQNDDESLEEALKRTMAVASNTVGIALPSDRTQTGYRCNVALVEIEVEEKSSDLRETDTRIHTQEQQWLTWSDDGEIQIAILDQCMQDSFKVSTIRDNFTTIVTQWMGEVNDPFRFNLDTVLDLLPGEIEISAELLDTCDRRWEEQQYVRDTMREQDRAIREYDYRDIIADPQTDKRDIIGDLKTDKPSEPEWTEVVNVRARKDGARANPDEDATNTIMVINYHNRYNILPVDPLVECNEPEADEWMKTAKGAIHGAGGLQKKTPRKGRSKPSPATARRSKEWKQKHRKQRASVDAGARIQRQFISCRTFVTERKFESHRLFPMMQEPAKIQREPSEFVLNKTARISRQIASLTAKYGRRIAGQVARTFNNRRYRVVMHQAPNKYGHRSEQPVTLKQRVRDCISVRRNLRQKRSAIKWYWSMQPKLEAKQQEINETATDENRHGSVSPSVHECYLNVERGIPENADDDGDVADEFYICHGDGARGWLQRLAIGAFEPAPGLMCSSSEESDEQTADAEDEDDRDAHNYDGVNDRTTVKMRSREHCCPSKNGKVDKKASRPGLKRRMDRINGLKRRMDRINAPLRSTGAETRFRSRTSQITSDASDDEPPGMIASSSDEDDEEDDDDDIGLRCVASDTSSAEHSTPNAAPAPTSPFMQMSACISRLYEFDADKQIYVSLPAFDSSLKIGQFLASFKVQVRNQPKGIVLMLLDSGSTCLLSPCEHHFPVKLKCDIHINGVGGAKVDVMSPQVLSILDDEALSYITFQLERGYCLPTLGFGLLPTGPLEAQGFEFHLRESNPYFVAPDKMRKGHLIKDYVTGMTWVAERPNARPCVEAKRAYINNLQGHQKCISIHPEVIGEIEAMPSVPDSKERIDRELGYVAGTQQFQGVPGYFCGGGPALPAVNTASEKPQSTPRENETPTKAPSIANQKEDGHSSDNAQKVDRIADVWEKAILLLKQAEQKAAQKIKPVHIRIPTRRLLDVGESEELAKFIEYWHNTLGHLEWDTIEPLLPNVKGGDYIKAIYDMRQKRGKHIRVHCDACARMKTKTVPPPKSRVTRPTAVTPEKIYIDASGLLIKSVHHGFQYYIIGVTETGFMLLQFITFKSQTLFALSKMFREVGGPPQVLGMDNAGELKSANSKRFFASQGILDKRIVEYEHWKNAHPERGHDTVKTMSRCGMAHANAPIEWWPYALQHMVLTANMLLPAKDKNGQKLDITRWQAHYKEQPDILRLLIGPWGCLAYITLTKEARNARGIDKSWGPRAIGGVFLGCYVHPKTAVFHFLIHDGNRIMATSGDLRVVGDCFPLRWQRARDVQLRLTPPDLEDDGENDEDDDGMNSGEKTHTQQSEREGADKGKLAWVQIGKKIPAWPCLLWSDRDLPQASADVVMQAKREGLKLVWTLGDYMFHWAKPEKIYLWKGQQHSQFMSPKINASSKLGKLFHKAIAQAEEESSQPRTHWPTAMTAQDITAFVVTTLQTADREARAECDFVNTHHGLTAAKQHQMRCGLRDASKTRSEQQLHRTIIDNISRGTKTADDYLQEKPEEPPNTDFENPADFSITDDELPDEFQFDKPWEGAPYFEATPVDFTDPAQAARECKHPATKLIGRGVRKSFTKIRRRGADDRGARHTITGQVVSYDAPKALFKVVYKNRTTETLDLVNLKQILVMDKKWGDCDDHHGKTLAEVQAFIAEHAFCTEFLEEYLYNRISASYGEGETTYQASPQKSPTSEEKSKKKVHINEIDEIREYDREQSFKRQDFVTKPKQEEKQKAQEETRKGCLKEEAFFVPQLTPSIEVRADEIEEPPRDDEPRNKKEAENFRCQKCRKSKDKVYPCEKCLEERKGIYECWDKETSQLQDKKVFRELTEAEVTELKKNKHRILNSKMISKRKYEAVKGSDGVIRDRFLKWKGRIAAVGSPELKGVDMPWSTFSPVVGITAVRTIMSLMCRDDFTVNAYDLSGAYLAADLDRPVFMKLPPECGDKAGKIVALEKAIYGLKTSSRDYVEAFSQKVREFEVDGCRFEKLYSDGCIYRFIGKNGEEIFLCHYVDDLIIGGNSPEIREKLLNHLRQKWGITDEGPMTRFVGLNFSRSANGKTWDLSCAPYIDRVGVRFELDDGKYPETPMESNFVVTPEDLKSEPTPEQLTRYRSLIGSIGFAATTVRYDIAYAVSTLSRYLVRPNEKVIAAAERVIKYLIKTKDFKITWSTDEEMIDIDKINRIWGAVDASFASDPITRRSHGGFIVFNNGGAISWKSGLQKMVTLSSCESEYVALCAATMEICYLRQLMCELGRPQKTGTLLWEDNKACLIVAEGETSGAGRSKHIDIKFKYVTENIQNGSVNLRYIPTSWNYADMLTKPLGKIQFRRIVELCRNPEKNGITESQDEHEKGLEALMADDTDAFMAHIGDEVIESSDDEERHELTNRIEMVNVMLLCRDHEYI